MCWIYLHKALPPFSVLWHPHILRTQSPTSNVSTGQVSREADLWALSFRQLREMPISETIQNFRTETTWNIKPYKNHLWYLKNKQTKIVIFSQSASKSTISLYASMHFSNSLIIHEVNYRPQDVYHIMGMCLDTQWKTVYHSPVRVVYTTKICTMTTCTKSLNTYQGSTLTFHLTSLVSSDSFDVTGQNYFLLAKLWCWLGPITAELLARLESTMQTTPFHT